MLKEAIATASTIDEARDKALAELSAPQDVDVTIEVLEMPVKKTFGLFGGSPAKVRAYYEIKISPKDSAVSFIKEVVEKMGVKELKISAEETEATLSVTVDCEDNSIIIGRHGDTLDALQYLAGLVANKNSEDDYYRVSLNTGSYREKREKSLTGYARKVAIGVTKTGKSVTLEPMNPYERRIIHTAVQGINGATSHSIGEGNDRKVVISLEEGFKPTGGRGRGGRGGRGFGGHGRGGRPRHSGRNFDRKFDKNPAAAAPEADEPRQPHSDVKSAPLYGKIENID